VSVLEVEVQLLGPLVVRLEGCAVAVGGAKERAVLSLLALRTGSVVTADELLDALWGQLAPPATALKALHNYVSKLRRILPAGVVATVPGGYRADLAPDAVDAVRFQRAVAGAWRAADVSATVGVLEEALAMWRGPPLADLSASSVGMAERTRLTELRADAEEELYEARLAQGEHPRVVAGLEAAVAAEPLRERRWGQLMLALYRCGRQADALRAFQRLRAQLGDQLGIEPNSTLKALEEAILLQKPELDWPGPAIPAPADIGRLGKASTRPAPFPSTFKGAGQGSVPAPLLRASRWPLVGRTSELKRITGLLDRTLPASPIVLVVGEAGAGKTRLAAAFADLAASAGAVVLFGRCDEGLRVPYQPFVEALGSYITEVPEEVLAVQIGTAGPDLARLLPVLTERIAGLPQARAADPETDRWRLFQAVAHLLGAISAANAAALIIDNLHWAEPATLLLLRHLARERIDDLLVVATARSTDHAEPDAFDEALADMARDDLLDTVALAGLNCQEVAAVIAERLDRQADTTVANTLHSETGGNPFFLHELITHLIDLGLLNSGSGEWPTVVQIEQSGAPQGVRHVLSRRVRHLSAAARETLSVAAVAGAQFQATDLVEARGGDVNQTLTTLEEAANSGLINEIPPQPGRYRFAHALVRHTLYETLSSLRRAQLHWRVAEAIRATDTQPPQRLNELAYHYRHGVDAGVPAVAMYWLQQAGDRALSQLAFEEAIEHYRGALAALDLCPDDPSCRYDLLVGLGEAADAISDYEGSHPAWLAAAGIARDAKDPARFFQALVGHENVIRMVIDGYGFEVKTGPDDMTVEDLIDEGLELAGQEDSPERAQLLAWKGAAIQGPATASSREHRQGLVLEALAMARRTGSHLAQQAVLGTLGELLWGSSQAENLMAVHREQLKLLQKKHPDRDGVWPYRGLALAAIELGRRAEADAAIEQAETLAHASGRRLELHGVLTIKTALAAADGRFDEAKSLAADIRHLSGRNRTMILSCSAQVCAIRAEEGQADRVIDGLRHLADDPSPRTVAWRAMMAGLCADAGYLDEAVMQFSKLVANRFAAIPRESTFPLAIRYLAEICAQLSIAEPAVELLSEVEPYSGQLLVVDRGTSIEAAADRSLGQLYGLLDRFDDADRHFDAACSS
jgi:DNA-binding SARP family transcriptional activator